MKIIKFTKINLEDFLKEIKNKKHEDCFELLVDTANFNRIAKIICQSKTVRSGKNTIPKSEWFKHCGNNENKFFIVVDESNVIGYDFMGIMKNDNYISGIKFYELIDNKKKKEVLKCYFDNNIIDIT